MKKRILSMALATTMMLSLFGCGASEEKNPNAGNESVITDEADAVETDATEQEPVTLKFYALVEEQNDQQAVFDKLNEYFQEKYNTTVEWNFIASEFDSKMSVIIGSGEEYDACFTSNWRNDYTILQM